MLELHKPHCYIHCRVSLTAKLSTVMARIVINMRSFNFKIIYLIIIYSCVSIALRYKANVSYPFIKMKWRNTFNLRLVCDEQIFTVKECVKLCYYKEKIKEGCTGFILNTGSRGCSVCKPPSLIDIAYASYTQITDNHVVYFMKRNKKPDVYFPLEPENITETTVAGDGISGTLLFGGRTSAQTGKVGQGLHVQNGGQIVLPGSGNECFLNIASCPDESLTIMFWTKKTTWRRYESHLTYSNTYSINLLVGNRDILSMWVIWNSSILSGKTIRTIDPEIWTHVTAVFSHNIGLFIYLNGVMETFKSISESENITNSVNAPDTAKLLFGGKFGQYHYDGVLDEIKLFYKYCSSSGKGLNYSGVTTLLFIKVFQISLIQ